MSKERNLVIVRTKDFEKHGDFTTSYPDNKLEEPEDLLYIIDGKVVSKTTFEKTETDRFESIEVIKGREEVKKITSLDYDGVIKVTTKAN